MNAPTPQPPGRWRVAWTLLRLWMPMPLRLRRQSLAGYDDAAFGLDLGLLVKPLLAVGSDGPAAGNWTLGLAVRNAVEPSGSAGEKLMSGLGRIPWLEPRATPARLKSRGRVRTRSS